MPGSSCGFSQRLAASVWRGGNQGCDWLGRSFMQPNSSRDDMITLRRFGLRDSEHDTLIAAGDRRQHAMSARTTPELLRQATKSVRKARGASIKALPKPPSNRPEHGRQIFVYNHLQKNHVVYSLTRALNVLTPFNSLNKVMC
jgi:Transcriptional regulation of mitochondrial recombination